MKKKNSKGYTLIEIMITVAILGVVASTAPYFFTKVIEIYTLNTVKFDIQRDARTVLDLMNRNLRQAEQSSIRVDRASSSEPPYSRIRFRKINASHNIVFYQEGTKAMMNDGNMVRTLCDTLSYLSFTFPRTDDMSIISVSLTVEKTAAMGRKKAIHVAIEKVRIMNE